MGGTWFEELGFYYVGPVDGHDLDALIPVLENVKNMKDGPVLIHVVTQKGKIPPINITAFQNSMSLRVNKASLSLMHRAIPPSLAVSSLSKPKKTIKLSVSPLLCRAEQA